MQDLNDFNERRISFDIDILIAIVGSIAGFQLTIWLAMQSSVNYLYPIICLFSSISCISYLVLKIRLRSASISKLLEEHARKPLVYLLLNILFFILILCALLAVALRPDLYSRPVMYFVCMALASAVLALEILWLPPNKSYTYFVLAKVILMALVLIWTPQVIFPGIMGKDPYIHSGWIEEILSTKHTLTSGYYSSFPVMHINIGAAMLLTNFGYKMAVMLSITLVYVIGILSFTFLFGRFIHSNKVGLMAALLLSLEVTFVQLGWWMIPNSYALISILALLYLLFKARDQHPFLFVTLSMLLMAVLIFTHTIGSLTLAVILFIFWLGQQYYKRVYRQGFKMTVTLTLAILFVVAMFSWWMYASDFAINHLQGLLETHFATPEYEQTPVETEDYILTVSFWENIIRNLPEPLFWTTAFVGCLAACSARFGNRYSFIIAIGGMALLTIGFIGLPLDLALLAGRWNFASVLLLATPAGFGILLFYEALKKDFKKVLLLPAFVAVLCLISITNPLSNVDNPVFTKNTTVRYAFQESEQKAMITITTIYDGMLITDDYYLNQYPYDETRTHRMTDYIFSGDYRYIEDTVVIIRKEIAEEPFDVIGIYKLDYDPREVMIEQGFSRIYDCDTVVAFIKRPS